MKQISNADFASVLRLLAALSRRKGLTVREKEDARKASLLHKKLLKKDGKPRIHKTVPVDRGLGMD